MFTNRMRMTGFSGIDVADMVHQMMRAESFRLDRLRQQRDINVWRQDMMRNVATSISQFQRRWTTPFATGGRDIGNPANWNANSATVASTRVGGGTATGATITAGTNATQGTHTLTITNAAQAHTLRSTVNHNQTSNASASTEGFNFRGGFIDPTANAGAGEFVRGVNFNMSVNGVTRTISMSAAELQGFAESAGNTFNMSAVSEAFRELEYLASGGDFNNVIANMGLTPPHSDDEAAVISHLNNILDTNFAALTNYGTAAAGGVGTGFVGLLNNRLETTFGHNPVAAGGGARVGVSSVAGELVFRVSEGNTAAILGGAGSPGHLGLPTNLMGLNNTGAAVNLGFNLNQSLADHAPGLVPTSAFTPAFTINDANFTIHLNEDDPSNHRHEIRVNNEVVFSRAASQGLSVQDLMNAVNNSAAADVNMSFNHLTGQFTMQARQAGSLNAITLGGTDIGAFNEAFFGTAAGGAQIHAAQDAEFSFNNVVMSRPTNDFTIEGIRIVLTDAVQAGDVHTIQVGRNTDNIREMVTDFVNSYNELMRSLLDLTEVRRPRQDGDRGFFMPLTEEQRRAMSDREIEMWEEQARTGILHRDDTLRAIQREMTDLMFRNIRMPDGRTFNLGNMGISLSRNPNEFGMLEIDEDRFAFALENHADVLQELFTASPHQSQFTNDPLLGSARNQWINASGLAQRLNDVFNRAISPTIGTITQRAGAVGTAFENQNVLSRTISNDNRRIDNMMNWLQRREDSLFRQFSRMEQAMMQANSQMMFFEQLMFQGF